VGDFSINAFVAFFASYTFTGVNSWVGKERKCGEKGERVREKKQIHKGKRLEVKKDDIRASKYKTDM
jgi:hypothetical protein